MRKLLAILLLAFTSLTSVAPLFALSTPSQSTLRLCCRKDGAHHCAGNMESFAEPSPTQVQLSTLKPVCPFCPAAQAPTPSDSFALRPSASLPSSLLTRTPLIPRTASPLRLTRERSRPQRGPPSLSV